MEEKVKKFDKKKESDPYKKPGLDQIGYFEMTMKFATGHDKLLFAFAALTIVFISFLRPMFPYMFG